MNRLAPDLFDRRFSDLVEIGRVAPAEPRAGLDRPQRPRSRHHADGAARLGRRGAALFALAHAPRRTRAPMPR